MCAIIVMAHLKSVKIKFNYAEASTKCRTVRQSSAFKKSAKLQRRRLMFYQSYAVTNLLILLGLVAISFSGL